MQLDEGAGRILPNYNTGRGGGGGGSAAAISLYFRFQLDYLPYERTCITDHTFNQFRRAQISIFAVPSGT
jgi:hypothetical protein